MRSLPLILKQGLQVSCLSLTLMSLNQPTLAVTVDQVPNPRQQNGGWVTDMADLLTPATENQLNQKISELETKNSSEIAVVTVPNSTPSVTPKAFANSLFNHWHIGKKEQKNGVLLLISKDDRRVEIVTGDGVKSILSDAKVKNIIQQEMIPHFQQRNFNDGTLMGTEALVVALEAYQANSVNQTSQSENQVPWGLYSLVGVGALALMITTVACVKRRQILVSPDGRSRIQGNPNSSSSLSCSQCKQPMEKLDETTLQSYLNQPEKVAQQLGSIKFEGWRCLRCRPQLTKEGVHIRAYVLGSNRYSSCPTCQELTLERTHTIVQAATEDCEGIRQTLESCHCCFSEWVTEERIPCLTRSSIDSDSYSSSDSGSGYTSDDSSYSSDNGNNYSSDNSSYSSYTSDNSSYSSDNGNSYSSDNSSYSSSDSGSSYSSDNSSYSSSDYGGGSSSGSGAGDSW